MFALVDVKDENGTLDLFPHDCMLIKKIIMNKEKERKSLNFRSSITLENRNVT